MVRRWLDEPLGVSDGPWIARVLRTPEKRTRMSLIPGKLPEGAQGGRELHPAALIYRSNEHAVVHDYQAIIFGYHANKEHHGTSLKRGEKEKKTQACIWVRKWVKRPGIWSAAVTVAPTHSSSAGVNIKGGAGPFCSRAQLVWHDKLRFNCFSQSNMNYDYNQTKLPDCEDKVNLIVCFHPYNSLREL